MVSNNFIMHIVSATTAIISLILLMASVYYGLYEQWIYVAICIVAIVLDFYIHMVLVNKINNKYQSERLALASTFFLYRLVNYRRSQNL